MATLIPQNVPARYPHHGCCAASDREHCPVLPQDLLEGAESSDVSLLATEASTVDEIFRSEKNHFDQVSVQLENTQRGKSAQEWLWIYLKVGPIRHQSNSNLNVISRCIKMYQVISYWIMMDIWTVSDGGSFGPGAPNIAEGWDQRTQAVDDAETTHDVPQGGQATANTAGRPDPHILWVNLM